MSKQYFALKQGSALIQEVQNRVDSYDSYLQSTGAIDKIQEVYNHYYGLKKGSLRINKSGEQGEITNISINNMRNFIQHTHVLVTQNKLAFECQAINSDFDSQAQTLTGKAVLQYENDDKGLNQLFLDLVEQVILSGEHYVSVRWNPNGGEPVAADLETNKEVMSGSVDYKLHHMADVIRDTSLKSNRNQKWQIVREDINRYDLAAAHPDFADEILNAPSPQYSANRLALRGFNEEDTDSVEVLNFYHDQSAAVPRGRQVVIVGNTIIEDRELGYRRIPVYRMAASNISNTILAYTVAFDLCPIQQAQDALFTAALTNNLTFAMQNIWCPDPNLSIKDIGDGLNLMNSAQKPEAVQLTASAPELYKLIDILQNQAQLITAVNSATRGQPEASLKSGASLALVASMAISFMSNLQQAYADIAGQVGTAIIETLQRYATAPQLISMSGKTKRSVTRAYSRDDISMIRKVIVRLGNALQQTTAGRVELAQNMLKSGLIKNANQYLTVIETGSLDALDEIEISELLLIRDENEKLSEGEEVYATLVDDHIQHILAHRAVLSDVESRRNPEIIRAVLAHIQEHLTLLPQVPPELAQAMGLPPPQPPQDAMQPMPQDPTQPAGMPSMPNLPSQAPANLQAAVESIQPPPGVNQ